MESKRQKMTFYWNIFAQKGKTGIFWLLFAIFWNIDPFLAFIGLLLISPKNLSPLYPAHYKHKK